MTQAPTTELAAFFADAAALLGLSRPAGQCFAAVWHSAAPPDADALMATTGLSRSAVSTALKELREAGLVQANRLPGTRREGFTAPSDPWALLRLHLALRLRRDVAPMLDRLRLLRAAGDDARVAEMADMIEMVAQWLARLSSATPDTLAAEIAPQKTEPRGKKKKKKG
ncbi:MAG: ArsR family transcriptional regulator [Rhodobacteraceae bacterium]|nr:ArsR family transcriptional regulator [Paracoccaceae bacterium]